MSNTPILRWANSIAAGFLFASTSVLLAYSYFATKKVERILKTFSVVLPFSIACERGNIEDAKTYIKLWFDNGGGTISDCKTPLHAAAYKGHLEICKLLLDHNVCNVDAELGYEDSESISGVTPLLIASEMGFADVMELLIRRGANINHKMSTGQCALHGAVQSQNIKSVQLLLSYPLEINAAINIDGATALHVAVANRNLEMVNLLLKYKGIDVNAVRATELQTNCTPLHFATDFGQLKIVRALLEAGANVEALTSQHITPLSCAARYNYVDICKILLEAGANPSVPNFEGTVPLHFAVINKSLELVKLLLSQPGLDINAARRSQDTSGVTPLHLAAEVGALEIAKLLVDSGADVDSKFNTGQTPLMTAAWKGHCDIVKYLLSKGANPSNTVVSGTSALLIACEALRDDIVEELLNAGASLDATIEDGGNALNLACANSEKATRIVSMLLERPGIERLLKVTRTIKNAASNITILHLCAEADCVDIMKLLLKHDLDIDAQLDNGETPLITACYKGHLKSAQLLIEHGADVNANVVTGATPLMAATKSHNLNLIKLLLDKGADISAVDDCGDTALHYAYIFECIPIIKELEARGANTEALNYQQQKPHEVNKKHRI